MLIGNISARHVPEIFVGLTVAIVVHPVAALRTRFWCLAPPAIRAQADFLSPAQAVLIFPTARTRWQFFVEAAVAVVIPPVTILGSGVTGRTFTPALGRQAALIPRATSPLVIASTAAYYPGR